MKIGFPTLFASSVLGSLAAKFVYTKFKDRENEVSSGHLYTYIVWTEDTASTNKNIIGSGYVLETDIHKAVELLTTGVIKGTVDSLDVTLSEALFNVPNGTVDGLCEDCSINVTMEDSGIKTSDLNVSTASFTFIPFNDGLKEPEDKKDAPAEDTCYYKWTFSIYKAKETVESSGTSKFEKTGYPLAIGHVTVSRNTDDMTRSELIYEIIDSMPSISFHRQLSIYNVYGNGKPSIEFFVTNTEMSLSYGLKKNMENSGGLYFVAEDTGKIVSSESSDIILIESAD